MIGRNMVTSLIRHGLTLAAGYLVAQGLVSEADAATFVSSASMVLAAVAWSAWEKYAEQSQQGGSK